MSVTYFLFRVKEPMSKRPVGGLSSGRGDFLPLGPLTGIADRLESALAGLGPVSRTDHPGGPAVNPFTGAPFEMNGKILEQPPHVLLRFQAASRELEAMVQGDPVTSISINRCVPQDFLPVVDVLADLAPFAILCDSSDTAVDPEEYRPRKPRLVEGVFTRLPPLEGVPSGQFLIPRWRLEGRAHFSEAPLLVPSGLLLIVHDSKITAVDARTGHTRWTADFQHRSMHATPAGAVIVCAGSHPRCFGLSAMTGETVWQAEIDGEVFDPGVVLANGSVALAVHKKGDLGSVRLIRPETSAIVWSKLHSEVTTMSLAAAGASVLVGAGNAVYCERIEDGELQASFAIPPVPMEGGGLYFGGAPAMVAIDLTGVFLGSTDLTQRGIPDLDGEEQILSFPLESGFERFLCKLTQGIIAVGTPDAEEGGSIRIFESPGLRLLHELPIAATPSAAVAVTPDHWACLLRPLRQPPHGPRRDGEAEVIIVELRSGRVVHREPLGCRGWYPGHVAGGDGWLFATMQRRTKEGIISEIRGFSVGADRA